MNAIRFTTIADLRNWVSERADATEDEIDQIADVIREDADFPAWGRDCTTYLASLPDLLVELLDE